MISHSRNIIASDECPHLSPETMTAVSPLFFVPFRRSQEQVHVWKKTPPTIPSLCPHAFKVSHSPTKIPAWLRILKGSQLQFNREGVVLWAHCVVGHKPSLHSRYNKDTWITCPDATPVHSAHKKKDMDWSNISINCPGPESSPKHLTLSFLKKIYTQGWWVVKMVAFSTVLVGF